MLRIRIGKCDHLKAIDLLYKIHFLQKLTIFHLMVKIKNLHRTRLMSKSNVRLTPCGSNFSKFVELQPNFTQYQSRTILWISNDFVGLIVANNLNLQFYYSTLANQCVLDVSFFEEIHLRFSYVSYCLGQKLLSICDDTRFFIMRNVESA
jgi:hypothetical protein